MKDYESDVQKGKRRKRAKRRANHRRLLIFFLTCGCLAVLVCAVALLGGAASHCTAKLPSLRSVIESEVRESDISVDKTAWSLILVNKWNPIFHRDDIELVKLADGESVDQRIYPALQSLFDAARNDGIFPVVVSGYRTEEKQQSLLDEKIQEYKTKGYSAKKAAAKAEAWVAMPGTSEHQLGIAVDINADGIASSGDEVYEWLGQNAYRFGFIRRYPPDKTEITGVLHEPWHYRYVGMQAAAEMQEQGACLEEYLNSTN